MPDHGIGVHAVLAVGYDDAVGVVHVANSWGTDFGVALLLTACAPDVYLNEKGPEAAEEEEEQEESPVTGLEDKDSDGYAAAIDCDDAHATVNPDAEGTMYSGNSGEYGTWTGVLR